MVHSNNKSRFFRALAVLGVIGAVRFFLVDLLIESNRVELAESSSQSKVSFPSLSSLTGRTTTNRLSSSQQHLVQEATNRSKTWFLERQAAYYNDTIRENSTITWPHRGIGYVYHRHKLLLAAIRPSKLEIGQRQVIQIFNTLSDTSPECDKWTLWVRVAGPEIFAGSAMSVPSTRFPGQQCHWEFPFTLQKGGDYFVDSKILLYNGSVAPNLQCDIHNDYDLDLDRYPLSVGFLGFKLYDEVAGCCEICAREPLCQYWTTPPLSIISPVERWKGCELFFNQPANSTDFEQLSRRLQATLEPENQNLRMKWTHRDVNQRHRKLPANESKVHPEFRPLQGIPKLFHGPKRDGPSA